MSKADVVVEVVVEDATGMVCTGCGRRMRPANSPAGDVPGSVTVGSHGECSTCTNGPHTIGTRTPNDPFVPVRTMLRPWTFRLLETKRRELGLESVGELLSRMADAAVPPLPAVVGSQPRTERSTPAPRVVGGLSTEFDAVIRERNAAKVSDSSIAREIGKSQTWVSRRRGQLGLEPPRPRTRR